MKIFLLILLAFPCFAFTQRSTLSLPQPELIPFKFKSKFGYVDSNNRMIIEPRFDYAEPFFQNTCWLRGTDSVLRKVGTSEFATAAIGKERYRINRKGDIVYKYPEPPPFCVMSAIDHPLRGRYFIIFSENRKYGVKCGVKVVAVSSDRPQDTTCIIIPPIYDTIIAHLDRNQPFIAKLKGKYGVIGVINGKNEVLVPFAYDLVEYTPVALLKVRKRKEVYYVDYTGREFRGRGGIQKKNKRTRNSSKYSVSIPKLTSQEETFDTGFFRKIMALKNSLRNDPNKKISISHESYEEYDAENNVQKHFFRGIGGSGQITTYDYLINPVIGVYSEYYSNGRIKTKGIYCWFGFKIGMWYKYNEGGDLQDSTNHDEGYKFNYDKVFAFCDNQGVPLEKKNSGYRTTITKVDSGTNSTAWLIQFPNSNKPVYTIIKISGSTGKILMRKEMPLPVDQ